MYFGTDNIILTPEISSWSVNSLGSGPDPTIYNTFNELANMTPTFCPIELVTTRVDLS
jgi:hypothetical protein